MTKHSAAMVGALAIPTAVEIANIYCGNDGTVSALTRLCFRTHTRPGRALFVGALIGASAWFARHTLKEQA